MVGEVICLQGGRFYTLTFCEPGNNPNTYAIQSISGITGATGLITRQDVNCAGPLTVTGVDPSTVVWRVKSPNDQTLLRYLSCTNCLSPIFTPDINTPPTIVYEVCGTLLGMYRCNANLITDCKDVTVTTLPAIRIGFDINPGQVCANNIPTIHAAITPDNPLAYTYKWYNAPNATGTIVSTSPSWTPTGEGSYSLLVTEILSGVSCNTSLYNFTITFDSTGPTIVAPPAGDLFVQCGDPNAEQQINAWLATAISTYTLPDGTIVSRPSPNDYHGIAMACGTVLPVHFTDVDQCGNSTTVTSNIHIIDNQAPTWLTAVGNLNRTVQCDDTAGLTAAQALIPVPRDNCDNSLIPVKVSGAFVAGSGCPQAGKYTNTWTVKDACNNTSITYIQEITIIDDTRPVWNTAAGILNRTLQCNDAAGLIAAQSLFPVANDNCDFTLTPLKTSGSLIAGACPQSGTYTNTWTVSDKCGNSVAALYTQIITIVDDTKPTWLTTAGSLDRNMPCSDAAGLSNAQLLFPVASDNCSNVLIPVKTSGTFNQGSCPQAGTYINSWTVSDDCGNAVALPFTQIITLYDNIPPTANLLPNLGPFTCYANIPAANILDVTGESDNCGGAVTVTHLGDSPNPGCSGTVIRTYRLTDPCSNYTDITQNITILDNVPPTANTLPNLGPYSCYDNRPAPNINDVTGETDNCGGPVTVVFVGDSPDPGCSGTVTRTYKLTDACGNSTNITQQILISRTDFPSVPSTTGTAACVAAIVVPTPPTIADACGTVLVPTGPVISADPSCNGTKTYTWTYTDCSGHTHNYVHTVTVTRTDFAAITPTTANVTCVSAIIVPTFPVVTDACGTSLIPTGPVTTADPSCNGTKTYTWTYTDCSGHTHNYVHTAIVNDNIAPIITSCPGPVTGYADNAECFATGIVLGTPVAIDNCTTVTITNNAPVRFPVGITTVIWTATDACGNISTCIQTVTITDNIQPPTISCPANVVQTALPGNCALNNVTIDNPATWDNCGVVVLTWTMSGATTGTSPANGINYVSGQAFNVGITTVTYTAGDAASHTASCSFNVWIKDLVKPSFLSGCPADITKAADAGVCTALINVPVPTVSDPCNEGYTVINSFNNTNNASGNYPIGSTTVTWTITDASGNVTTCSQIITVTDTQLPTITCQADVEEQVAANNCSKTGVNVTSPTITDNCPNPVLTWTLTEATTGNGTGPIPASQVFNVGKTTVNYTVTDAGLNTATCSFQVWIKSLVLPQFSSTCPINVSVPAVLGLCNSAVTVPAPVITNPCNEAYLVTNNSPYKTSNTDASGTYPAGITTITWTITDASGTAKICTQTVTVTDTQAPVFTLCPPNTVDQITNGGCNLVSANVGKPTFTDNCGIFSLTYTLSGATNGSSPAAGTNFADGVTYNVGVTTVTYTVTDVNGLSTRCSHTVWIKNLNAPQFSFTCPGNVAADAAAGVCNAAVTVPAPVINNPCNEAYSVTNNSPYKTSNTDASGTYPAGITTITWTITDASGTAKTCTQTVTVTDTQAPVFTLCPPNAVDQITNGGCNLVSANVGKPTFTDNCGIFSLTYTLSGATNGSSPAAGTNFADGLTYNVGVTTVTYTVTDVNGLSTTCSQTVWIKNLTAPKLSVVCPGNVNQPADPNHCDAALTIPAPLITNPCNEAFTVTNNSPYKTSNTDASGTYPVGVTIVIWTITDASGNVITCTQSVTVNDLLPTLTCPNPIIAQADYELPYKDVVVVPPPSYGDNCPNPVLTWTSVLADGTTSSGINIYPSPSRFYVGVTTITYTLTDSNNHTVSCSFTVTVLGEPDIDCRPDINVLTDAGVCSATLDPGFPVKISGVEPITYTWTMSGATTGSGTGPIGSHSFNLGNTTITWRAENISGYDECTQLIIVRDIIKPSFTPPLPLVVCVENIHTAIYNAATVDINPVRPDYFTFVSGSTTLDIDPLTFTDNCNLSCPVEIRWRIDMNNGTLIPALPAPYQTGQPSAYGNDIQFLGDGTTFGSVIHTITYWIVDCWGNVSDPVIRTITVNPRPNLTKLN